MLSIDNIEVKSLVNFRLKPLKNLFPQKWIPTKLFFLL